MPELAEVEYYRKQWSPAIGQVVADVHLHTAKRIFRGVDCAALTAGLIGQTLRTSMAHGKQMVFVFGQRHWLGVHLGMTGRTSMREAVQSPSQHEHLVIGMRSGAHLVFSDPRLFGRIQYANCRNAPDWWAKLPPTLVSEAFTLTFMQQFLQRRAKAPIKAVLLMQEAFPGIGNWMADEILWRARIHPATRAGAIHPQLGAELYLRIREVCRDALEVIGTDWGTPPDDWLFNHRWKDGGLCPRTACTLRREKIGGRTTCWSPLWQKTDVESDRTEEKGQ